MLDDPYYAHHSPYTLEKPLTVCAFLGGKCGAVAQSITALSGLPLVDIDRMLEHRLGKSLRDACEREGLEPVMRQKTALIHSAIDREPCAVIGLGDITLVTHSAATALKRATTSVYLEWRPVELRHAISEDLDRHPGRYPRVDRQSTLNFAEINALMAHGNALFNSANHRIVAAGREPYEIAQHILATILEAT